MFKIRKEIKEILRFQWNYGITKGLFTPSDSDTVTITLMGWAAPLIFMTATVTGRMGCIPILPVNVTFVTVTVTESPGVNES